MAKGKGAVVAAFIGSIVISLLGAGAAGYFLLPLVFPGVHSPAFVYEEFESTAQKLDNELTWTSVPDTFINITVRGDSRILCKFSASYLIGVADTLGTNKVSWEVVINVDVVGNKSVIVMYWDNMGVTNNREIASSFYVEYATEPLLAGEYTVRVLWRSLGDQSGINYLLFRTPTMDYNRSLSALEILN